MLIQYFSCRAKVVERLTGDVCSQHHLYDLLYDSYTHKESFGNNWVIRYFFKKFNHAKLIPFNYISYQIQSNGCYISDILIFFRYKWMIQSNEPNGTSFAINLKFDAQQVCVYGCVSPFHSDVHGYSHFNDLDAAVMLPLQRSASKTMRELRFLLLFSHKNDGATPSMSFYRETHA